MELKVDFSSEFLSKKVETCHSVFLSKLNYFGWI